MDRSMKIICIQCPVGCIIEVEKEGEKLKIRGNECKRGKEYAMQEMENPKRMVTTTVFVEGGMQKMLPVRSEEEIPKELVRECVKELASVKVKAPIKCGEVIYKNILGTGVNIIASRDMEEK